MSQRTGTLFSAGLLLAAPACAFAAVHYVDVNSVNSTPPYTDWPSAARNIQDAVDSAVAGDEVMVTNGLYATGARTVDGLTTNRVAVDKPLGIHSLNGPQFTIIDGGATVRCVYLTNSATLSGFTLTNGSVAGGGGGVFCESQTAVVSNCVMIGNWALPSFVNEVHGGGGAFGGTLNNCILSGNSAAWFGTRGMGGKSGGGAESCVLNNCTVSGNSAGQGGGVSDCNVSNCWLTGNVGNDGGGAYGGTLVNCDLSGNHAIRYGGGAGGTGGGALGCTLNNCTLAGNRASSNGGGALGTLNNCIVYFNTAPFGPNYQNSTMNYCCTIPLPANGVGNIGSDPLFVDTNGWANLRLQPISPCINGGNNAYTAGTTDLDGNPRMNRGTVDIGAYEFQANIRYVDLNSPNATPPYTSWSTAATNIQDAVDAALAGDEIVVTNGTYATGGRDGNRVKVDKPLTVRSATGPSLTVIDGVWSARCVYLTNSATLCGFLLSNGAAGDGGGVFCTSPSAVVSNCVVAGNFAIAGGGAYGGTLKSCVVRDNSAGDDLVRGYGGGANACTLNNCAVTRNWSQFWGGGAYGCTLNNCTIAGNSANPASTESVGGGALGCTLNNCIVCFNTARQVPNSPAGNYCWMQDPLFVDYSSGNLRLQSNSPCINAGNNSYVTSATDLDGNPRIVQRTVDVGAYEFQGLGSTISYAWLQQYGLPTDGSADFTDPDSDGLNNWQEWRCGTDPTNVRSALRLLTPIAAGTNLLVTWQSVAGVNYSLERSLTLSLPALVPIASNIVGQAGTTTFADTNVIGPGPFFYRVGVEN